MKHLVQTRSGIIYPKEQVEYKPLPPTIKIQDEESKKDLHKLFSQIINHSAFTSRGIRVDSSSDEVKKCRNEILWIAIRALLGDDEAFETFC